MGAGFTAVVWNRSRDKAEPLIARGARWSDNPLAECDRVVICLYTTEIVDEVLDEMQFRPACRSDPDRHHNRRSRTNDRTRRTARRNSALHYLESPIAASSEQTRQGQAMAIVAGPDDAFAACRDLFDRHRRAKPSTSAPPGAAPPK